MFLCKVDMWTWLVMTSNLWYILFIVSCRVLLRDFCRIEIFSQRFVIFTVSTSLPLSKSLYSSDLEHENRDLSWWDSRSLPTCLHTWFCSQRLLCTLLFVLLWSLFQVLLSVVGTVPVAERPFLLRVQDLIKTSWPGIENPEYIVAVLLWSILRSSLRGLTLGLRE